MTTFYVWTQIKSVLGKLAPDTGRFAAYSRLFGAQVLGVVVVLATFAAGAFGGPLHKSTLLQKDNLLHKGNLSYKHVDRKKIRLAGGHKSANVELGRRRAKVKGTVKDKRTGDAIPNARITVSKAGVTDTTGPKGKFALERVQPGTQTITANHPSYKEKKKEVSLSEENPTRLVLRLKRDGSPSGTDDEAISRENGVGKVRAPTVNAVPESRSSLSTRRRSGTRPPPTDRENYAPVESNDFKPVSSNPLSTFSIDVDGASYANIRRMIENGRRPPKDAVRTEELINYFRYDYSGPEAEERPFAVNLNVGQTPWAENRKLVQIGIQGRRVPRSQRPPANLVFLVDVSGSMRSRRKLPLLKEGLRLLADQLRPEDQVSMVTYAGSSGLVLEPTPGDKADRIKSALSALEAGGSTAGAEGIRTAYRVAEENAIENGINRVILCTDGDFNVGVSSDGALRRLIERKRKGGTSLTALGFGTGNLQDSKMETLSGYGNGNYYYIDSNVEARRVLVDRLGSTLQTIAKDVKLQVEFNPSEVESYRLIGYVNRKLDDEDFADDSTDAGELGAGHAVTALYDIVMEGSEGNQKGPDPSTLKYQKQETTSEAERSGELLEVRIRHKRPGGKKSMLQRYPLTKEKAQKTPGKSFKWSSAVAGFGMLLRESEYMGSLTADKVRRLAEEGRGKDKSGRRASFIGLLEEAESILELPPPSEKETKRP